MSFRFVCCHHTDPDCPDRKSTGAGAIEAPKANLSDDAKARALQEMEGRTGETDSEGEE